MLTPRENFIRYFKNDTVEWRPSSDDYLQFASEEIPDNVARGFVFQEGQFPKEKFGGQDLFGVEWFYDERAGGSMEVSPLFDDIAEWKEKVVWPDIDKIDWEGCKACNTNYLNTDRLIRSTIYTGYFERLISFVGFENAAISLVDDDQVAFVHKLFNRLDDFYIEFIRRMNRYFRVELIELHDDWGTQRSPMFSFETHRDVIIPHVKKVVDGAHASDVFIEMHSCGMVEPLMPNFIEAGFDTWRGQDNAINKLALVKKYGDRFKFGAGIHPALDASEDDILAMCNKFKEDYANENVWLTVFPFLPEHQKSIILREMYGE